MDRPHIRRLARTDRKAEHALLNIRPTGSAPLDAKIVATDQQHVYHGALADAKARSLQASTYDGDLPSWKAILAFALWQRLPEQPYVDSIRGVEAVTSIKTEVLTITIRRNVGGITQKLGEIRLDQDDEREEIGVFDWVDAAVATSDELRGELETLSRSVTSQRAEIEQLSAQLDELVLAKKEHEDELLGKFATLLNAKKLKIRDQQHLLETAKIDPAAAEAVDKARGSSSRAAASSRKGKRKASGPEPASDAEMEDVEDEDHAGPAHADVNDEDDAPAMTPELMDADATESEADGEDTLDRPASQQQARSNAAPSRNGSDGNIDIKNIGLPPPRRGLPFSKRLVKDSVFVSEAQEDDDDDDDETDDEL